MRPETLAVHAAAEIDRDTGAVSPPIHLSTTFEHPADSTLITGYLYQRYANPTQDRLEAALAAIDNGAAALAFGSGMAAGAALLQNLPDGGEVLMADDTYFAFRRLAERFFPRWGLSMRLVDMSRPAQVAAAISDRTVCLWAETPSNPRLKVSSVEALAALTAARGIKLVVDATFATPALLNPIALGADAVLHSTTKYIGGHSDAMGGALIFKERGAWYDAIFETRKLQGGIANPFASWLMLRGIRTLPARLRWQCDSAGKLADYLAQHPGIERVHYPGRPEHPGHAVASREMRGYGGMLSVEVAGSRADALRVASSLRLFVNATSLGGYESLVEHRESVEGPGSPTPANLLRLSVGLEHVDDLIADWAAALA
jgi:cystathionine gamma-synthase